MNARCGWVGLVVASWLAAGFECRSKGAEPPAACGELEVVGCVRCAVETACREHDAACRADPDCGALDECLRGCHETADEDRCVEGCRAEQPEAAKHIDAMDACLERVCQPG